MFCLPREQPQRKINPLQPPEPGLVQKPNDPPPIYVLEVPQIVDGYSENERLEVGRRDVGYVGFELLCAFEAALEDEYVGEDYVAECGER